MADLTPANEDELELATPEEDLYDSELEEDQEDNKLSTKQIVFLVLFGFFSFLIFLIWIFPVEDIVRSYTVKYAAESGMKLDFKNLDFSLITKKKIDSLYILTKGNSEIKSEEVEFDLSLTSLNKNQILGDIDATSFFFDTGEVEVKLRKLIVNANINNYDKGLNATGSLDLQTSSGQIQKLPNFPFLGDLSGTAIKSISLSLKKSGQSIVIEKGNINLSIAQIAIRGKIDVMSSSFMNSSLNIEICPKLTPEFSAEREDLANTMAVLSRDGQPCIPIKGTIAQPMPDLSKLNMGSSLPVNSGDIQPPSSNESTNPTPEQE
jgi:hypothetical protein